MISKPHVARISTDFVAFRAAVCSYPPWNGWYWATLMNASKTASTTQSGPLWDHASISPVINGSESAKDAIYWSRLVCVENRGISLFEIVLHCVLVFRHL